MPSKLTNLLMGLGCFTPLLGISILIYFFYQQSFEQGFFAGIASIMLSLLFFGLRNQLKRKHRRNQLKFLQTFQPDRVDFRKLKSFTSYDLLTKIAIDHQQQNIYVWLPHSPKGKYLSKAFAGMPYVIKTYHFSDLLAIKFIENDYQMAFIKKDTHYTSFLLNKIQKENTTNDSILPPVDKINSMDLEIIVSDNETPKHRIRFYYEPRRQLQKDSPRYGALQKECQKWFNRFKGIIYETEQNMMEQNTEGPFTKTDTPITEETFSAPSPEKKMEITIDIDTKQHTFRLSKESPEENSETQEDDSNKHQPVTKPTSYFEQLVKKNRRQLRGDYTDDE